MKSIKFWAICAVALVFWKLVFSTDIATDVLSSANASPNLTSAQIKQIEEIAQAIAAQSNANRHTMLDEMTVSFHAVAIGRNVRFENVIRTKKGLPPQKIKEWLAATSAEIVPKSCSQNAKNPAFDRGLSYTFAYSNAYGEKLGEVLVDKPTCKALGL
jgi:hypothetical protein